MGPYIMAGILVSVLLAVYHSVPEKIVLFIAARNETVRRYFELEKE